MYTDLRKAFDKVSLPKLIEVLQSYGIHGKVLDWFEVFLFDRTQKVRVNQSISQPLPVTSGVPQGSVVGPLLFLLFIDDITKLGTQKSKLSLFADDAKVYSTDDVDLQSVLYNVDHFFSKRQLSIAPEKCEVINFSKHKHTPQLSIGGTLLTNISLVKDLGILITDDLRWRQHVLSLKTKAMQRSYMILRSFNSSNIWILIKAYTTYVRPILEYASSVWNPHLDMNIDDIESVQRYFTKRACYRCRIPFKTYSERLEKLNMQTLEYRRLMTDIIMTFKITHNLLDVDSTDFFTPQITPYNTRSHRYQLKIPLKSTFSEKSFFANRITTTWNKLPQSMFFPDTLASFKNKLKLFDLHKIIKLRFK